MRKALYILADLKDEDLRWFIDIGNYREVSAGEKLIEPNKSIDALYIITQGKFTVTTSNGKQIAELASGDILGEMSLIEKRLPSVSVSAIDKAKILVIPQVEIHERLKADDGFAARFYRALAVFLSARLRSTVATLGYGDASEDDAEDLFEDEHTLDEGLLDTLHVAGDRMRRLINILEGREDG